MDFLLVFWDVGFIFDWVIFGFGVCVVDDVVVLIKVGVEVGFCNVFVFLFFYFKNVSDDGFYWYYFCLVEGV